MKKLIGILLLTAFSSTVFGQCASDYEDTLDKMRGAEKDINEAYQLYKDKRYKNAISLASQAKMSAWEGGVEFEGQLRRGICDRGGPSGRQLEKMIRNTKTTQNNAACIVYLSKMEMRFDKYINTTQQTAKQVKSIRHYATEALDVCHPSFHDFINLRLAYFH